MVSSLTINKCAQLLNRNYSFGIISFNLTYSFLYLALGGVPSPFDCYLCNRGLKTLHLRMERHFKNAMAAAKFLESDPRVEGVIFPGWTLSTQACLRLWGFEFSSQLPKAVKQII